MRNIRLKIRAEAGFALVVTLLVTAVLVAVVVEFAYSVYVATARAANFSDSQRGRRARRQRGGVGRVRH